MTPKIYKPIENGKDEIKSTVRKSELSNLCESCGKNPRTPEHPCPYYVDMYNDTDYRCSCCPDCEYECAMDI